MASESLLNNYYNRGGYNQPSRIGFRKNGKFGILRTFMTKNT